MIIASQWGGRESKDQRRKDKMISRLQGMSKDAFDPLIALPPNLVTMIVPVTSFLGTTAKARQWRFVSKRGESAGTSLSLCNKIRFQDGTVNRWR